MPHSDVEPLPGFHPEIGLLLATLQDSTREWREQLGDVSTEAIVWQPVPGAYSVGALLLHIIDCEDAWFCEFAAGNSRDPQDVALFLSDETDQYIGQWPVPPAKPLSWYFALHDQFRARAFECLRGVEPTKQFARRRPGNTCSLRWVVAHVLQHDSYTGGQAVAVHELYLKSLLSQ